MQVFIVQSFLSKQDLWKGKIDGIYSSELEKILEKFLLAHSIRTDGDSAKKLLLAEQLMYRELGLTEEHPTGENSTEFQQTRAKYVLDIAKTVVTPEAAAAKEEPKQTSSKKSKKK